MPRISIGECEGRHTGPTAPQAALGLWESIFRGGRALLGLSVAQRDRFRRRSFPVRRRLNEVHSAFPWQKSHADEYSDKARECEELAQAARDPFIQQQILEIAEKWRTMAAFEEKFVR